MSTEYNYYKARFSVVTARRAQIMGVQMRRSYGYAVLIDPPVTTEGRRPGCERLNAWCKTKAIAERNAEDCRNSQRKGYYGCPCGNHKQARACCGIPNLETV